MLGRLSWRHWWWWWPCHSLQTPSITSFRIAGLFATKEYLFELVHRVLAWHLGATGWRRSVCTTRKRTDRSQANV